MDIIDVLKISFGDFSLIKRANPEYLELSWLTLMVLTIFFAIILLNFIVAEASARYESVSGALDEVIIQDRCSMISEAIKLTPRVLKN